MNCLKCNIFSRVVNGVGNIKADIMIIGQNPGYYENKYGVPFIGASGKLLTKHLQLININRKDIWITNVVKCKTPNNRQPYDIEVKNCLPFLVQEIKEIKPKIIILLGKTALSVFMPNATLNSVLGKWYRIGRSYIFTTYHPSYIIRNPELEDVYYKHFLIIRDKYKQINPFYDY